jgi:sugar phosphate isomerase/epimerase
LDAAATRLDKLARRLARRSLQVAVAAFPWFALTGAATVPKLRRVRAPNVGQLVDVWPSSTTAAMWRDSGMSVPPPR